MARKEECYDNIQCTSSAADSNLIAANEKYFAVPWQGGGGPFFVNQLDKPGKVDATPSLFQGHSGAVLDLDFNPFATEVGHFRLLLSSVGADNPFRTHLSYSISSVAWHARFADLK